MRQISSFLSNRSSSSLSSLSSFILQLKGNVLVLLAPVIKVALGSIVSGINRRLYLSGTTPAASIIRGSRVTALTEAEMLFDRPRDMEFWRVLNIDEFLSVLDSSDFDLSIDWSFGCSRIFGWSRNFAKKDLQGSTTSFWYSYMLCPLVIILLLSCMNNSLGKSYFCRCSWSSLEWWKLMILSLSAWMKRTGDFITSGPEPTKYTQLTHLFSIKKLAHPNISAAASRIDV